MMRSVVFLVSVICVATVLTELLGLSYLWLNGQLSPAAVQDIRVALGAEEVEAAEDISTKESIAKSYADIDRDRALRGFELLRRYKEVRLLNSMAAEKAEELKTDRDTLTQIQGEFQQQLALMREKLNGESVEQSRAILLKMDPADAVSNLMAMPLERNVLLLKGMPEKSIAVILQEFLRGNDPKLIEREQEIFKAISDGQPSRKMINETASRAGGNLQTPPVSQNPAN